MSIVVQFVYDATSWMLYSIAHVVLRDLTNYYWNKELVELEQQNDLSSPVPQNVSTLHTESSETLPTTYKNEIQECISNTDNLVLENSNLSDEKNYEIETSKHNIQQKYDWRKDLWKDFAMLRVEVPEITCNETVKGNENGIYSTEVAPGDYTNNICSNTDEILFDDECNKTLDSHKEIDAEICSETDSVLNYDEGHKTLNAQNTSNKIDEGLNDNECDKSPFTQETYNEIKQCLNNDEYGKTPNIQDTCNESKEVLNNNECDKTPNIQDTCNESKEVLNNDECDKTPPNTQDARNESKEVLNNDECDKTPPNTEDTCNEINEYLNTDKSDETPNTQDTCNKFNKVLNNDERNEPLDKQNTHNEINEILNDYESDNSWGLCFVNPLFSEQVSTISYENNFKDKTSTSYESNVNKEHEIVDNILKKYTSRESSYPVPDENGNTIHLNLPDASHPTGWEDSKFKSAKLFDKMSETTGFLGSLSGAESECDTPLEDRFLIGLQPERNVAEKCNRKKYSCDCYKTHGCLQVVDSEDEVNAKVSEVDEKVKEEDEKVNGVDKKISGLVTQQELHSIETGSVSDWLYRVNPPTFVHRQPETDPAGFQIILCPRKPEPFKSLTISEEQFQSTEQLRKAFYIEQWLDNSKKYSTQSNYYGSGDFL